MNILTPNIMVTIITCQNFFCELFTGHRFECAIIFIIIFNVFYFFEFFCFKKFII